jgi:hypothetical protein
VNALHNFCKDWKLDINPNKTKVIVFCKKEIPDNTFGFYYSHNIIEITDKYKYLGIVFKNTGLLKYASENLANKARKVFYLLKSKISQSDTFSVKTWIKLYNSVILPIITYGPEIWLTDFNLNLDTLGKLPFEKVQNMIFKNILGVHGKASNLAINAEFGYISSLFLIIYIAV